jgi:hypothetical protein
MGNFKTGLEFQLDAANILCSHNSQITLMDELFSVNAATAHA